MAFKAIVILTQTLRLIFRLIDCKKPINSGIYARSLPKDFVMWRLLPYKQKAS